MRQLTIPHEQNATKALIYTVLKARTANQQSILLHIIAYYYITAVFKALYKSIYNFFAKVLQNFQYYVWHTFHWHWTTLAILILFYIHY